MSWRDKLRKGKLGGVAIFVREHDHSGGARLQITDFPQRDEPHIERMGKKARDGSLPCYLLGRDYMADRDALIEQLDSNKTLTLVHPYLGTMRIEVQTWRLRETADEGGKASFDIQYILANSKAMPDVRPNTAHKTRVSAVAALATAEAGFAEVFSVEGQPDFVQADALTRLSSALDAVKTSANSVLTVPADLTALAGSVSGISGQLTSLINTPATLASSLTGLISGMVSAVKSPIDALAQCRQMFGFGDDDPVRYSGTPARVQQAANASALNNLIQTAALIVAAGATADMEWASRNDAEAARDDLADRLDAASTTADDETYAALIDLRGSMMRDITARSANLAELMRISPRTTTPAMLLAYRVYGTVEREQEIVARNGIRHPGFVASSSVLEVLNV